MSVAVQHCLDGFFLFFGKCPIATEQYVFFQTILPVESRKPGTVGAAHKVVDGDMKIIGNPGKSGDIRFDVVVFIFIDGLLPLIINWNRGLRKHLKLVIDNNLK